MTAPRQTTPTDHPTGVPVTAPRQTTPTDRPTGVPVTAPRQTTPTDCPTRVPVTAPRQTTPTDHPTGVPVTAPSVLKQDTTNISMTPNSIIDGGYNKEVELNNIQAIQCVCYKVDPEDKQSQVNQSPGQRSEVKQLSGQGSEVKQCSGQGSEVKQWSGQGSDVKQLSGQGTEVKQSPDRKSEVKQSQLQRSEVNQSPDQKSEVKQWSGQNLEIKRSSNQRLDVLQLPSIRSETVQSSGQESEVSQSSDQRSEVKQSLGHASEIKKSPSGEQCSCDVVIDTIQQSPKEHALDVTHIKKEKVVETPHLPKKEKVVETPHLSKKEKVAGTPNFPIDHDESLPDYGHPNSELDLMVLMPTKEIKVEKLTEEMVEGTSGEVKRIKSEVEVILNFYSRVKAEPSVSTDKQIDSESPNTVANEASDDGLELDGHGEADQTSVTATHQTQPSVQKQHHTEDTDKDAREGIVEKRRRSDEGSRGQGQVSKKIKMLVEQQEPSVKKKSVKIVKVPSDNGQHTTTIFMTDKITVCKKPCKQIKCICKRTRKFGSGYIELESMKGPARLIVLVDRLVWNRKLDHRWKVVRLEEQKRNARTKRDNVKIMRPIPVEKVEVDPGVSDTQPAPGK